MSTELLNITVHIAGRPYRMKISSDEEKNVREAAKYISEQIAEYQKSYDANDQQDYLAMAALLFTTEYIKKNSAQQSVSSVVENALGDIDKQLTELESI